MLECRRLIITALFATALLWHCNAGAGVPVQNHELLPVDSAASVPATRTLAATQTIAVSQNVTTEGPVSSPEPIRQAGPRRESSTPTAGSTKAPSSVLPATEPESPHLPFGTHQTAQVPPVIPQATFAPPAPPQDFEATKPSQRQGSPKQPSGKPKKSSAAKSATAQPDPRVPRPYVPTGQTATPPPPSTQASPRMNPAPSSYLPASPATQQVVPQPSPASDSATGRRMPTTLPPLPAALPYNPTGSQPARAPKGELPDKDGAIMARIPTLGGQDALPPSAIPAGRQGQQELPAALPAGGTNPLNGFILDSFGGRRAAAQPQPVPDQSSPESTPSRSMLEQLGRDFGQLGQGIRETFSRVLPSR